jgi:hypothetical protein
LRRWKLHDAPLIIPQHIAAVHPRESSHQFIKTASQLFGQITVVLGTVST